MTDLLRRISLRRRVSLAIWIVVVVLCTAVLGFALR